PLDLFARAKEQGLAGADAGAHGLEADRGAVIAHVALHHQVHARVHLGHAKGTGQDTVVARDAAGLARGLHHAVAHALDRVRGADLGASGRIAVHTDHGHGLGRQRTVDKIKLDHRIALVGVAFGAGLNTRLAADAATRVHKEL